MEIFLGLIFKIAPLYFVVFLGYLAGKYLDVKKESVAALLIYFIAPLVIFNGVVTASFDYSVILLPLLFFTVATVFSLVFYNIGKLFWQGAEKNVLAFTAGSGNTGYFGLPLVLALFGDQYLSIAVLTTLGLVLYENSVGYYFIARGNFSPKDAAMKVLKLPTLYAFVVGVVFLALHFSFNDTIASLFSNFRGAYSVLGMMLVGLGLAGITRASVDSTFLSAAFSAKFIVWPVAVMGLIYLDSTHFHLLSAFMYPVMLLLSIVPLASNTVAFATQLKAIPEKAAFTVLASTLFALLYIPLFVAFVFPLVLPG